VEREKKLARLVSNVKLERMKRDGHFVHWSFDTITNGSSPAEKDGKPRPDFDLHWSAGTNRSLQPAGGRFNGAMPFDGATHAEVPFKGISKPAAHSFSFWMRLPKDTSIQEGNDVLSWERQDSVKATQFAVRIGWNTDPSSGPIGALRTSLGGKLLIGNTSLRDGEWHHIAVVIAPGKTPSTPSHVSQYLDGHLDVVKRQQILYHHINDSKKHLKEILFVGRDSRDTNFTEFRGELDELYVFDYTLTPADILRLMKENKSSTDDVSNGENGYGKFE